MEKQKNCSEMLLNNAKHFVEVVRRLRLGLIVSKLGTPLMDSFDVQKGPLKIETTKPMASTICYTFIL